MPYSRHQRIGRLEQQAARGTVTGLGDPPCEIDLTRLIAPWCQPKKGPDITRAPEAFRIVDGGHEGQCRDRTHARPGRGHRNRRDGPLPDALDGGPGVYSARFSGPNATDESNNRLLVEKLGDLPLEKSLELFEQGIRLSRECQERLSQAERRIEILLRDNQGRPVAAAFKEPEAAESPSSEDENGF